MAGAEDAPVPGAMGDLFELTKSLSMARTYQAQCEKELRCKWQEHMASSREEVKKLKQDLKGVNFEDYTQKIAAKKQKNDVTRSEIEALRAEKSILEGTASASDGGLPCLCIATTDIDGGSDSGYLSTSKGTVLVAIFQEEEHYYGYEALDPSRSGWWQVSATEPMNHQPCDNESEVESC